MSYNPAKHHRLSIRLRGWDYASPGSYFVTLCIEDRERPLRGQITRLFGDIVDGKMRLNEFGRIVADTWDDLPNHFPSIVLDAFVVMPNHMHGIIVLTNGSTDVGAATVGAGLPRPYGTKPALGNVIAYLKYQSAKHINSSRRTPGMPVWQRNYHEHIIWNDDELTRIRKYIADNPRKWKSDPENPETIKLWKCQKHFKSLSSLVPKASNRAIRGIFLQPN